MSGNVATTATRRRTLRWLLADVGRFARHLLSRPLRPYQLVVARAITTAVQQRKGGVWTVMMARQMGKNEVSAVVEAYLLTRYARRGGTIIKAAPTWSPQGLISLTRLWGLLHNPLHQAQRPRRRGQTIALGQARATFYSAAPAAQVVGATASLLLEVDEAQDVDPEKFQREFLPMASATNATVVLYGTAWTRTTLLEQFRQHNLAAMQEDGERRHFEFPWTTGAAANPAYRQFVQHEIARLGEQHPLIRTQYLLETVDEQRALFGAEQRLLLRGTHSRQREPEPGREYVAAVDVAGAGVAGGGTGNSPQRGRDSTAVGIAEIIRPDDHEWPGGAVGLHVVEVYWWTNQPLHEQYVRLSHLLREVWHCRRVVVDATGLGADLATRLRHALGPAVVEPFVFTAPAKSRLGYALLAAVNASRLRIWQTDHSPEETELWRQIANTRVQFRGERQMTFAVPDHVGHDDFVIMLALLVHAATSVPPPPASALAAPPTPQQHDDLGRY